MGIPNPVSWAKKKIRQFLILRMVRKYMDKLAEQEEAMAFLKALFTSKKAGAFLLGLLMLVLTQLLGLDKETAMKIAELIMAYLVGQGLADLGKK